MPDGRGKCVDVRERVKCGWCAMVYGADGEPAVLFREVEPGVSFMLFNGVNDGWVLRGPAGYIWGSRNGTHENRLPGVDVEPVSAERVCRIANGIIARAAAKMVQRLTIDGVEGPWYEKEEGA